MRRTIPILCLLLALSWAFGVSGHAQTSKGIYNGQFSGTSNNVLSGAAFNILSGADLYYSAHSAANTNLLFVNGSSGLIWPLQLGGGLSVTGSGPYTLNVTSGSPANPSAHVGTSTVNGSASTFMRSDAAPGIDLTMVPTWTGLHSFDVTAVATGGTDYGLVISPTLNQRNATNFIQLFGNQTVTQAGTGHQYFEDWQVGGTDKWIVDNTGTVQTGAWNGTAIPLSKLASMAANTMVANATSGSASPTASTLSAFLDSSIDNSQGDIIFRNSTVWTFLGAGASGQVLTSGGVAANVSWTTPAGITGPGTTTNNGLVTWNGTAGGTVNTTTTTLSSGAMAGINSLTASASTPLTLNAGATGNNNVNLSPSNSGVVNITSGTGLQFGTATSPGFTPWASAYITGAGSDTGRVFTRMANSANDNPAYDVQFGRGTIASPTTALSGDDIVDFVAGVYDGSAWVDDTARISFVIINNQTNADHGGNWQFWNSASGSITKHENFQVSGDGSLQGGSGIPQTFLNSSGKLIGSDITGDTTAQGGNFITDTAGKTLLVKSGSNALAGTVVLVAGLATITSTAIDANTVIVFSEKTSGGTPGLYQPLAAVTSGSATVTSAVTDTSTYNWVALKVN